MKNKKNKNRKATVEKDSDSNIKCINEFVRKQNRSGGFPHVQLDLDSQERYYHKGGSTITICIFKGLL